MLGGLSLIALLVLGILKNPAFPTRPEKWCEWGFYGFGGLAMCVWGRRRALDGIKDIKNRYFTDMSTRNLWD